MPAFSWRSLRQTPWWKVRILEHRLRQSWTGDSLSNNASRRDGISIAVNLMTLVTKVRSSTPSKARTKAAWSTPTQMILCKRKLTFLRTISRLCGTSSKSQLTGDPMEEIKGKLASNLRLMGIRLRKSYLMRLISRLCIQTLKWRRVSGNRIIPRTAICLKTTS